MSTASIAFMPHAVTNAIRTASHRMHTFLDPVGKSLTRGLSVNEREREEAYLAESVDRFDLERRMRELDCMRQRGAYWPL